MGQKESAPGKPLPDIFGNGLPGALYPFINELCLRNFFTPFA